MSANTEFVRRMVGVVASIAVVTWAGIALGGGRGPAAAYDPPSYTPPPRVVGPPTVDMGKDVFAAKGCAACHTVDGSARVGPSLQGRWGTSVALSNGTIVTFDELYLRESLGAPQAKAQAGYPPSMPSYEGIIKEREIRALALYLKSL